VAASRGGEEGRATGAAAWREGGAAHRLSCWRRCWRRWSHRSA
jgi:hypothetical protein